MNNTIPDVRHYQCDYDFAEVRILMTDRSVYEFGRVSAAARFARGHGAEVVSFEIESVECGLEAEPVAPLSDDDCAPGATNAMFEDLLDGVGAAPEGQDPLGGVHTYNIEAATTQSSSGGRGGIGAGRWGVQNTRSDRGWKRRLTAHQRNSAKAVQKTLALRRPVEYISVSRGFEGDLVVGASDIPYTEMLNWLRQAGYVCFDRHDGRPEILEYFRLAEVGLDAAA